MGDRVHVGGFSAQDLGSAVFLESSGKWIEGEVSHRVEVSNLVDLFIAKGAELRLVPDYPWMAALHERRCGFPLLTICSRQRSQFDVVDAWHSLQVPDRWHNQGSSSHQLSPLLRK